MKLTSRTALRGRRHQRLRKSISGTAARPRMSVFMSNRHIGVQFIDDVAATTLAAASTESKGFARKGKKDIEAARELGGLAAEVAKEKGIKTVVFDRGGNAYEGRLKALADAAREAGLKF